MSQPETLWLQVLEISCLSYELLWMYFCAYCYHFSSARYSTDGQTPGCVRCPTGFLTRETGATSEDQCEGNNILLTH